MRNKTKWIIIKVVCAVVFIVGAVAIGLGISHATKSKVTKSD
jgi:flagellar basal body-associated protein FliL